MHTWPPQVATLRGASLLVGMHPDQATEFIVSCALALHKPWAVVPCCVFGREFPTRRLDVREKTMFTALVECNTEWLSACVHVTGQTCGTV
jgi:hypothetical protein